MLPPRRRFVANVGKLYNYLLARIVYLASILIFMVGSIVAAVAQNSPAPIVGWGCAGTLGGSVLMISYVAEPKLRPMLIGCCMGVLWSQPSWDR